MIKHFYTLLLLVLALNTNATIFNNTAAITINDNATASPYPSTMSVSGMSGTVTSVKVKINGLTHAFVRDVSILLQAPTGQALLLQSFCADGASANNLTYTIADAGAAQFNATNIWANNGTYKPTSYMWDIFPSPAPLTPPGIGTYNAPGPFGPQTATFASTFNGIAPNGTWKLFVADFAAGDGGTIAGGWNLEITTGGIPLPISAINLEGINKNNTAFLHWSTEASSYSHFDIQESAEGINFYNVAGLSNRGSNYNYQKEIPDNTTSYYRIKGTDADGNLAYSNIIQLNRGFAQTAASVYPTLTRNKVSILTGTTDSKIISVYNIGGQEIFSMGSDQSSVELSLQNLSIPEGNYVVQIRQNGLTESHRVFYQP